MMPEYARCRVTQLLAQARFFSYSSAPQFDPHKLAQMCP